MLKGLITRLFQPTQKRSLEAAGGGRRWSNDTSFGTLTSDTMLSGAVIRRRAAYYARYSPHAARASAVLAANIIGCGIKPQSQHENEAVRDSIDQLFASWCPYADTTGLSDFYGLQTLVVRPLVESGEAFVLMRVLPNGVTPPLRLQLLSPEQIDRNENRELGGSRIVSGVELDSTDRPVAYWVLPAEPGGVFARPMDSVRIPAEDIVHVFERLAPGQVRGLPWLTPVLTRLRDLDSYEDAQCERQRVSALFAGFLTDPNGTGGPFTGDQSDGILTSGLEPGTLKVLPAGTDIKFSDPAELGGEYKPFIDQQLRSIAAGLGITFEQLSLDMTGVNYSSARVALIEFRRRVEALQEQLIVHQFCRRVWDRFISLAALAGALPETAIGSSVKWVAPAFDWIDPLKDAQAEALQVASGFKSRRQVILERGQDPDTVDKEIASDTFVGQQPNAASSPQE
jgi:lambda family phage portal protein